MAIRLCSGVCIGLHRSALVGVPSSGSGWPTITRERITRSHERIREAGAACSVVSHVTQHSGETKCKLFDSGRSFLPGTSFLGSGRPPGGNTNSAIGIERTTCLCIFQKIFRNSALRVLGMHTYWLHPHRSSQVGGCKRRSREPRGSVDRCSGHPTVDRLVAGSNPARGATANQWV